MRVAHKNHIDARNFFRDRDRFVFMWHLPRTHVTRAEVLAETHVHRDHNNVSLFLFAQDRHPLARFVYGRVKLKPGVVGRIVPVRHARRGETKYADSHTSDFFNDVRFVVRLLFGFVVRVRGEPREVCFAARFLQDLQAEVVFVIADSHRVVVQRAHHEHHRIWRRVVLATMKRREWRTLDRIAGIDQQNVRLFFADAFDQRGNLRKAAIVSLVGVVIDGVDVAVQIRGAEDRDLNALRGKASAHQHEGEHDDQGCQGVNEW